MSKVKNTQPKEKRNFKKLVFPLVLTFLFLSMISMVDIRLPYAGSQASQAAGSQTTKSSIDIVFRLPGFLPQALPRRGTMFLSQGKAAFQRKDKSWFTLSGSAPLKTLDAITTKDDGQVAFEQFDGLTGFLDKNAIVKLNEGQNPQVWSLNQGRILLNPKKLLWVETPQAVVEIGANSVVYLLTDEQKTIVSMGFGQALVRDVLKQGNPQTINPGQKTMVPRNGVPAPPIADDRLNEISLLADRCAQTLNGDRTIKKLIAQKLGRKPQSITDLIAAPVVQKTVTQPVPPKKSAPPKPGPAPANPQVLINEENRTIKALEAMRQASAKWAFNHPGEPFVHSQLKSLGIPIPSHSLSGKLNQLVVESCPLACPAPVDAAWLFCAKGGLIQWKVNDKDKKGRDLCQL